MPIYGQTELFIDNAQALYLILHSENYPCVCMCLQIFRDIISNRMEEIAAAAIEIPAIEGSSNKQETKDIHEGTVTASTTDAQIASGVVNITNRERQGREEEEVRSKSPKPEASGAVKDLEEEHYSERSRSYKRKRHYHRSRSRSRSGSRSRSKERHHKKHKKHRSRSHSREKSRHRKKHKRHSRSKSPSN